jgi:hypothetical protein
MRRHMAIQRLQRVSRDDQGVPTGYAHEIDE